MKNIQLARFLKISGILLFFVFTLNALLRIFFREEYSRENYDDILKVILGLAIVRFVFRLLFDKEQTISDTKSRLNIVVFFVKRNWPEILIFVLLLLFGFLYKRNIG